MKTIVQIVPKIRPISCGIGDYAEGLDESWQKTGSHSSRYLVGTSSWKEPQGLTGCALPTQSSDSFNEIWPELRGDALLVHFSGYGYAPRGAPVWLVRALKKFRVMFPSVPLITMFHELFAFGPPTTSAFWLSPLQRWVTAQVARLSDTAVTNRGESAVWLGRNAPKHQDRIHVLPVFSNLGEQPQSPPPSARKNHLVLFAYQACSWPGGVESLHRVLMDLKPDQVTVLGKPSGLPSDMFNGIPVEFTGFLDAAGVSAILREARLGYLAYEPAYLGKSGILAAYLAHGVVPLLARGAEPLSEGLERGRHLLADVDAARMPGLDQLDAISTAGRAWYQPHDREHTAAAFADIFQTQLISPA